MRKRFENKVIDVVNKIKSESPYEYDSITAPRRAEALRDKFTRQMLINSIWYSGSDVELKKLYEKDIHTFKDTKYDTEKLNYFWAQPTDGLNIRKIHFGIPQLISEKMVDLIKANGYEYTVYDDEMFETENEDNKKRLDAILNENQFDSLLNEAIETESWAGGVAFKISSRSDYKYPILEVVQPDEYEPVIEVGRIVGDIFIKYYYVENEIYKLKEEYGVEDVGAFIKYQLYHHVNGQWLETELTAIKETAKLENKFFIGIREKLSLYKPNKLPNSDFRGSRLGESDYSGSHGIFDAIDEVGSTMVQEFRDGKIKNFWPSDLLPLDPVTKQQYIPAALEKDFI